MAALKMPLAERYEPVRDAEGYVIRRVKISRGEMTCLDCGETTNKDFCTRCVVEDEENGANGHSDLGRHLVPSASYLREGEYILL